MTISTELRKAGPFTGNGVTTAFPFSFKVFAATDVTATRADTLGAETGLVLNTDFTVALNADQDAAPGGTVTLAAPLSTGYRLVVSSAVPNLQPTDITNNGGFYPREIEDALDRHVAQIQQIDEKVARALKVAVTSPLGDQALPSPVAGMLIGWNESNDGLKNYAPIGGTLLGQQLAAANGSSLVGFQQAGAVVRTAQDKMREWVSVKDFGAVGDGVADDTIAIQAALNVSRSLLVPAGTYLCGPLSIPGNSTIWFDAAAHIMARVGFGINESLITISAVSDVTIHGNGAVLQMRKADYTSGEWRHCVNIVGANNVKIYDLVVKDSGGDGFYVGGDDVCRNVSIVNCVSDNNRRQGLSITNAINCLILGGEYKNTIGTLPEAGIDVESNLKDGYYLQNINIIGVLTQNNNGSGILIAPQSKFAEVSINVLNCTSIDDAMVRGALTVNSAMAYTPETDPALIGKIKGRVTVDGFTAIRPKGAGVVSTNWTEYAPTTLLKNIYVLDCGNAKLVTAPNRERCGLLIKGETPSSGLHGASIGNIEIENFEVRDSRDTKLMSAPIYFEPSDEASKPIKNVRMRSVRSTPGDWTVATAGVPVLRAGSLPVHGSSIGYYNEVVVATGSVTVDLRYSGLTLTNTSSAVSYSLPAGADLLGAEFEFEVGSANYLSLPLVSATDTLMPISTVAGKGIRSNAVGSRVRLKAENGKWRIVSIVGTWGAIP